MFSTNHGTFRSRCRTFFPSPLHLPLLVAATTNYLKLNIPGNTLDPAIPPAPPTTTTPPPPPHHPASSITDSLAVPPPSQSQNCEIKTSIKHSNEIQILKVPTSGLWGNSVRYLDTRGPLYPIMLGILHFLCCNWKRTNISQPSLTSKIEVWKYLRRDVNVYQLSRPRYCSATIHAKGCDGQRVTPANVMVPCSNIVLPTNLLPLPICPTCQTTITSVLLPNHC